jgi:hypothetical protein
MAKKAPAKSNSPTLPPAFRDRLMVVDNFLDANLAEALRRDIDLHFSEPAKHAPATHQIWNYWHVPGLYTYLRTQPENVVHSALADAFVRQLTAWSIETLGLSQVSWPYLSLYVPGCEQGLHNDARNGRFGFVYSLTRNGRKTIGGRTIVHQEGDPVRALLTTAAAGSAFYDAIEPSFNRLVLFDDRLPHAVERIEGSMDPQEGRFVLHGHLTEGALMAIGALHADAVAPAAAEAIKSFVHSTFIDGYHGPLVLRLSVAADGQVADLRVVLDRVLQTRPEDRRWPGVLAALIACTSAARFPAAAGPTDVLLPFVFGQPPEA